MSTKDTTTWVAALSEAPRVCVSALDVFKLLRHTDITSKIVRDVFASVTDMRQDASAETLCEAAGRAVGAVQVLEPEDSLDDLRYGLLHERDAEARAEAQRAPCRW